MGVFERAIAEVAHDPGGWIIIALLLGFLMLIFPWRHPRTIVTRRTYKFPPEAVWAAMRQPHPNQLSESPDPFDPAVVTCVYKNPLLGAAGAPMTVRLRILLSEPPVRHVSRVEDLNGRPFPFGEASTLSEAVRPNAGGCEAFVIFEGDMTTSFQALRTRWLQARMLAKIRRQLKRGVVVGS